MDISDLSNKDGGGWSDYGAAGMQTTALKGVDTKVGSRVGMTATVPKMTIYSWSKPSVI